MTTKEAADEYLRDNDWDYQKYSDRRNDRSAYDTLMKYEISDYIAQAFEDGAAFERKMILEKLNSREAFTMWAKDVAGIGPGSWADWLEIKKSEPQPCEPART